MVVRLVSLARRLATLRRPYASTASTALGSRASASSATQRSFTHGSGVRPATELVRANVRRNSTSSQQSESKGLAQPGAAAVAGGDHLALAKPLDFDVASWIDGQESQMVTFELEPGQVIRAEAGNLVFMEDGIDMDTNTGGGLGNMFRRVITGQNMFVTDYVNRGDRNSKVGLGTDIPSKILRLSLPDYGGSVICQRGAFLAGSHTIDIQTEFTKMMAGFFGGEGFVLQRLTGQGDAFVKASGPLIQRELREGETLRVSSGSVVAFSPTVQYDVQTLPGFKNVVFGGEGLFITSLTGPGTVFLQGLPFDRMVDQIARRIPSGGRGMGIPIPIGVGGGGGGGEGSADEAAGGAAGAGAAAGAEASAPETEGAAETPSSSEGLFGDAAPKAESAQAPGNPSVDGADAAGGWSETDHGFTEPPPESGTPGEETWSEGAFGSEGGAPDGSSGEGGMGMGGDEGGFGDSGNLGDAVGGDEGTGTGVMDVIRRLMDFFGDSGD